VKCRKPQGEEHVTRKAEIGVMELQAKKIGILLKIPRNHDLLAPHIHTSSLQNCEELNLFHCD
jgi:hypothetical protein